MLEVPCWKFNVLPHTSNIKSAEIRVAEHQRSINNKAHKQLIFNNKIDQQMPLWLKNILFTICIPFVVGGAVPIWIGWHNSMNRGLWNSAGLLIIGIGLTVLLMCIRDFGKEGEGTPFPLDPPKNLVTGRLYQYTRNPMYVAVLTCISGWAIWFGSWQVVWYGLAVAFGFNLFVRFVEEPFLKQQFGQHYEKYCKRVPRWL